AAGGGEAGRGVDRARVGEGDGAGAGDLRPGGGHRPRWVGQAVVGDGAVETRVRGQGDRLVGPGVHARRLVAGADGADDVVRARERGVARRQAQGVAAGGGEAGRGVDRARVGEGDGAGAGDLRPGGGHRPRWVGQAVVGDGAVETRVRGQGDRLVGPGVHARRLVAGADGDDDVVRARERGVARRQAQGVAAGGGEAGGGVGVAGGGGGIVWAGPAFTLGAWLPELTVTTMSSELVSAESLAVRRRV